CADGFLLDGFPRTRAQAEALEAALAAAGRGALDVALSLEIPAAEVVARMSGRRVCRQCGAPYHVVHNPPRAAGVCDLCGGEIYQRDDDREATVRQRMQVYEETVRPLKAFYEERGLLVAIDGRASPDGVTERVLAALERWH
ncbi:MAG: nucleoside monophosphate kinase, partial [Planctomycetes bacterium]|nr:nucleoside monophosphate kinase [Planctomycetota bacterium]